MSQEAYFQRFQEAATAARLGDYERAVALANAMLAQNQNDPNALQILGLCAASQGRSFDSHAAYQKANELAPNHPPILNSLGALMKQHGDLSNARVALETAIAIAPTFTEAHYNLASVYVALDERAAARNAFEKAIHSNPNHAEALAKFAGFLEGEHELEKACDYAKRALAIEPRNISALLTLAEIDARDGRHEDIIARLQALIENPPNDPQNMALVYNRYAKSLEKLHRYEEAFTAFTTANKLQLAFYADFAARQQSPRSPANLKRLLDFFQNTKPLSWSKIESLKGPAPVFLVGFPRSGTTLLDQILSSHPQIEVLEEKENLIDAWTDFVMTGEGLNRLPALTQEQINHYRDAYWKRAAAHIRSKESIIIDKLPLDTALLGLIYRLFPDAKIIFALRDPRDSIFSCYQQTFAMNAAMYQFLSLDTAASYYNHVMALGALYRERFTFMLHEVRYENVIADLESEIRPLLAFLELAWSENIYFYYETAKTRAIRTPSAKQVIQKPYASSIGKWRRYEAQMQTALPMLNKWAAHFGYDVH